MLNSDISGNKYARNAMETQSKGIDIKSAATEDKSAWRTYARFVVGYPSLKHCILYELITCVAAARNGALGILLRRKLYPAILGHLGHGSVIGRNVTIRGGRNIRIGRNVLIDEGCLIDARGPEARITIGDGVILSRNTAIRARNAQLTIGDGCDVGANCLLATDSVLVVGKHVLFGAFSYVCAGGLHRFDSEEPIIIKQGLTQSKGVTIGEGAWIGTHTTVLDGADIGYGSVIGAHSLVTRAIPDMSVAYGAPATVQRKR